MSDLEPPVLRAMGTTMREWKQKAPREQEALLDARGFIRMDSATWHDDACFPRWMVDMGWPAHLSRPYDQYGRKLPQAPDDALFPPMPGWGRQCQVTTRAAVAISASSRYVGGLIIEARKNTPTKVRVVINFLDRMAVEAETFFRRKQGVYMSRSALAAALEAAQRFGVPPVGITKLLIQNSRPRAEGQRVFVEWLTPGLDDIEAP